MSIHNCIIISIITSRMQEPYDYSNQSIWPQGDKSLPLHNNTSNCSESLYDNKNDSAKFVQPFLPSVDEGDSGSVDQGNLKKISFSQLKGMQSIVKSIYEKKKEKSKSLSQFIQQGHDLLDNDESSIKVVAPSDLSSSLEALIDLCQTSSIHILNVLEQLMDSHERHLIEEKELLQLRQKLDAMNAEKEKLNQENNALKQKVEVLNMTNNQQRREKDIIIKKYNQSQKQAAHYKSKLSQIYTYYAQQDKK